MDTLSKKRLESLRSSHNSFLFKYANRTRLDYCKHDMTHDAHPAPPPPPPPHTNQRELSGQDSRRRWKLGSCKIQIGNTVFNQSFLRNKARIQVLPTSPSDTFTDFPQWKFVWVWKLEIVIELALLFFWKYPPPFLSDKVFETTDTWLVLYRPSHFISSCGRKKRRESIGESRRIWIWLWRLCSAVREGYREKKAERKSSRRSIYFSSLIVFLGSPETGCLPWGLLFSFDRIG